MAVKESKQEPIEATQIVEPSDIVIEGYKSLDRQIEDLDRIPDKVHNILNVLLKLAFSNQDIFETPEGQYKFVDAFLGSDMALGMAVDAVIEIDRERFQGSEKEKPTLPAPQLPMPPNASPAAPNFTFQQPPQQPIKSGFASEWIKGRSWNKAIDKYLGFLREQANRPDITTDKVIDVLEYARQLLPERNRLLTFFFQGVDHVSFFNDPETLRNQRRHVTEEITKISGIINSMTTAIAQYRKQRFGEMKVSMAGGAMWLEAMKAGAVGRPGAPVSIDPNALNMRERVR